RPTISLGSYGFVPIAILIVKGTAGLGSEPVTAGKSGSSSLNGSTITASIPAESLKYSTSALAGSTPSVPARGLTRIPGFACPATEIALSGTQPALLNISAKRLAKGDVSAVPAGNIHIWAAMPRN